MPVCFYQKSTISRQAAFGEMQNATERQKLGGKQTQSLKIDVEDPFAKSWFGSMVQMLIKGSSL
jgi:hypothetical protein